MLITHDLRKKMSIMWENPNRNAYVLMQAIAALKAYISSEGSMETTKGATRLAIENIEYLNGKTYKRGVKGKTEALLDAKEMLDEMSTSGGSHV